MVVSSNIKGNKMSVKNYNDYKYFENRPDVVKIFEDLEAFHDWCRLEMAPFDESFLYNRESWAWRNFDKSRRPRKPQNGYQGHNHKPHYKNKYQQ
jgi:hypothetical protein